MSTLKSNISARRMALLATKKEMIFHSHDLANLWGIYNSNTLRVTLERYHKAGLLYRIYRGFYSLLPIDKLDPILIGAKSLHQFCYVSTESILEMDGYLSRKNLFYTFISKQSRKFNIGGQAYLSRQLKAQYLYQPEGIYEKDGVYYANALRAIADALYFNSKTHFDKPVDWKTVKIIQKKIGYPLTPNRYDSARS